MSAAEELDVETLLEALEALNDGIGVYGPDDRPLFVNSAAMRRFRTHYEALENGATYREALDIAVRKAMPEAPETEIVAYTEELYRKFKTGETYLSHTEDNRMVLATFRAMSRGRKAGISVDITELRKREHELKKARLAAEAASASKSSFLANMSHEIRTPLNGVMGMAQVLASTSLDDKQRDYVTTIIESSRTLMALLNDVLDLSKIEAGKFDIVPTDTDLGHVLKRTMRLWKPRAEEKGLEISLALDCELPPFLSFDSVRMQQCVSNLVSNAIKFTPSGRVDVHARARPMPEGDCMVEIRVSDTGCGMDEETLSRLFQPFAQADETTQRRHGGTGLGLSITRKLCQLMGGDAVAQSAVGQGSAFIMSFRASLSKSRPERRSANAYAEISDIRETLKASNLRVLLVDDHPINRQVVSLFLRPFNMRIVEAVNGAEALQALERETFDIVLLDMHMPVMDGPTTIRHIRSSAHAFSHIPVVALTADAMSGDKERYLAMGMDGYLSKPIAERDLLAEITRVCNEGVYTADRKAG